MSIPRRRRFPMRQSDGSRMVRANLTGRAVQELPGLAGAFGPLNMWVGPFHEFDPAVPVDLCGAGCVLDEIRATLDRKA